jgi:hypothetical protein
MSTPRGRQIKADQAKLLDETAASYTYQIIENTEEGRILQNAIQTLDSAAGTGSIIKLAADGIEIVGSANAYISPATPAPTAMAIASGDIWFDTTDNVIKLYNGTIWQTFGAAYL